MNAGVAPNRALAAGSWLLLVAAGCTSQLRSVAGAFTTAPEPGAEGVADFGGSLAAAAARENRQSKQSVRNVIRLDIEVSF